MHDGAFEMFVFVKDSADASVSTFSGYYLLKCLESMGDVSQLPAFLTALKSLFLKSWKGYRLHISASSLNSFLLLI